jgi:5-methylcytosine-specific restriction protein A
MEITDLKQGLTLSNSEITEIFQCSPQGGLRKSNKTKTLVVISDHVDSLYEDKWIDGVLHYTGMGQIGDQNSDWSQNRTLSESSTNGIELHLFEVFVKGQYTYQGKVYLDGVPYKSRQQDKEGNLRDVYIFPLKLKENLTPVAIKEEIYLKKVQNQDKQVRKLTDEEVLRSIAFVSEKVGKREVVSTVFERDPSIAEYTRRRANGMCDLCKLDAPFNRKDGTPYLEIHHINWLSKGGTDSVDNVVALCPNCHRKMHILSNESDIEMLKKVNKVLSY